jgi:hypothetical protein
MKPLSVTKDAAELEATKAFFVSGINSSFPLMYGLGGFEVSSNLCLLFYFILFYFEFSSTPGV